MSKPNSLGAHNDAIKAQDEMIDVMHQHRWDNASMHTKEEAADAKKLYDTAKEYKDNLEIAKADAIIEGPHSYAQGTGGVSDYDVGMKHAFGVGKSNPADAHKYAQGTGGVSDYDNGMKHAFGVGKPNPADAHKYAQGTGGVSDYDKGMSHALGGSKKANNPNVTSENNDSRRDYYNEQIKRAADDYLKNYGGRDDAETKQAFAEYTAKVNGLVTQRDAYNRALMGVDTSAVQGGGGSKGVSLSADGTQEMHVGLDDDTQSVFGVTNPQSNEEKKKKEIKDTFASIQAMTAAEKIAFMQSDAGKAYQQSLVALKDQIGSLQFAGFSNELFGENGSSGSVDVAQQNGIVDPHSPLFEDGNSVLEEKPITPSQDLLDAMFNAGGKWEPDDGEKDERDGSWLIGDKEYPILNNFETLDQMEVIDSYTITNEEFDTAGFLLGIPGYLSDSPGPLMFIETIANFAKGANDSLGRYSLRVDIINVDGEEKVLIAFVTKDNPLDNYYQNARWTKVDDEGTQIYVSNMWTGCKRYYIDKGHTTDDTLGYMYIDNGTLMFMPNILPNDKFLMSEKPGLPLEDVTALASQPFEIGQYE